jgi:hypothetical protein
MSPMLPVDQVRFVKTLYPRLKPQDAVIEAYRASIGLHPPIVVARGNTLVDGYHRWQANRREGVAEIAVVDLGALSDIEIKKEAYRRNRDHGYQLEPSDKKRGADDLYRSGVHDYAEIADLLGVTVLTAEKYCADARKDELRMLRAKAWDLWLDCLTQQEIADAIDVAQQTVSGWLTEIGKRSDFGKPPGQTTKDPDEPGYWGHIQHFDVWSFASAGQDAGSASYFGALPPQVVENVLWFFTEPGQVIVDLFAGSGTTVDVAKAMGRRVWTSDIRGDDYAPHLPIHKWDALDGWPKDAPGKADLVLLDPPYWKQASGRYSDDPHEMAEMSLGDFNAAWANVVHACQKHAKRIAFIVSPTQNDDGSVIDHATEMLAAFGTWRVERRVIVPYQTQQATGQQVTWARENRRMLKLYRDLVVLTPGGSP